MLRWRCNDKEITHVGSTWDFLRCGGRYARLGMYFFLHLHVFDGITIVQFQANHCTESHFLRLREHQIASKGETDVTKYMLAFFIDKRALKAFAS